jgi:hypothetical protein
MITMVLTCRSTEEIVGLGIGPSEAEPFWSRLLKRLFKARPQGRHAGDLVFGASAGKGCQVHWIKNTLTQAWGRHFRAMHPGYRKARWIAASDQGRWHLSHPKLDG